MVQNDIRVGDEVFYVEKALGKETRGVVLATILHIVNAPPVGPDTVKIQYEDDGVLNTRWVSPKTLEKI
jgi:hypothetical protein